MKSHALKYLHKNTDINIGIIEPIRRNTAKIIYADKDGVLIYEKNSKAYMISVDNKYIAKKLIDKIDTCNLISTHQTFVAEIIQEKFTFKNKLSCYQAVYHKKEKILFDSPIKIEAMKTNQLELIMKHYTSLSKNEILMLLKKKNLLGAYINNTLVGFIGNHLEGSIGILEIFPSFRRKGYAYALESYMVNSMLEKNLVPYAQIETYNRESIALHKKLGFDITEDILFWFFN